MKLLIATGNQGKVKEFDHALKDSSINHQHFELLSSKEVGLTDFPEETGSSYEENALIKAEYASEKTGLICLADDSGLEVDALKGAPGLYSARYGGDLASDKARTAYLLEQLTSTPKEKRAAKFVCSLVLRLPTGKSFSFWGESQGEILFAPTGQTGFGYDPVFYSHALHKSFAQASKTEKQQVSHRGNAIQALKKWLITDEAKQAFTND